MRLVGLLPVLTLLAVVYTRIVGAEFNENEPLGDRCFWVGVHTLLAYRVWRGGRLAWAVLFALVAVPPLTVGLFAAAALAGSFGYVGPLIGVSAVQAALLLLPRARAHVRRSEVVTQPARCPSSLSLRSGNSAAKSDLRALLDCREGWLALPPSP